MQRQPVSTCTHTALFAGNYVCVCVCVHSQVSVEVESDVGDIRTVQSQNMLLKCFSQHLTEQTEGGHQCTCTCAVRYGCLDGTNEVTTVMH